jgi:CxxC-x17-CxxC domain-containing protein
MGGNILHYGEELSDRFSVLRRAGYYIDRFDKIVEFRQALQSEVSHQAVSLSEVEEGESRLAILAARTYSRAPLILFHSSKVISFPAGIKAEDQKSDFDLVVPANVSSSTWISEFEQLIESSREILGRSQRIREESALLRRDAATVREKSRFERQRSESELLRSATLIAASAPLADRILMCGTCGEEFVFTTGEQLFFQLHKFSNVPKHCQKCRVRRFNNGNTRRLDTTVTCAMCGASTTVPFKPSQNRPVLCRACFDKNRGAT